MKTLLLDIETAPNLAWVWGMYNQNVSPAQLEKPKDILCLATEWLDEPHYPRFFSVWEHGKHEMALNIRGLLHEADAVITYNGDRFDIPHLRALMLTEGLMPPSPFKSIDLYKTMKQFELPFRKLGYVTELLGLDTKSETGGFKLWTGVLANDPDSQALMESYNRNDVSIMRDLYYRLQPWIKGHPNRNLYGGAGCTVCGSGNLQKRGFTPVGLSLYQRYRCMDCGKWNRDGKALDRVTLREDR
jgi:hypothetical protein